MPRKETTQMPDDQVEQNPTTAAAPADNAAEEQQLEDEMRSAGVYRWPNA